MKKEGGFTLIEFLVTVLIGGIIVTLFASILTEFFSAQSEATTQPQVQEAAADMAIKIAGSFRRASIYTTTQAPASSATASDVTLYTSTSGNTIRYRISSGNLVETLNSTDYTLYTGASLTMVYYQSASPNATALTSFSPTTVAQYKQIIAVGITGTISQNGYTATYATTVRLRNNPVKTVAF